MTRLQMSKARRIAPEVLSSPSEEGMFWFMMLKTRKDLWLEECRKRAVSFPVSCFWKPVGDVIFVPLLPRESVAFLPGSVLRLLRFYVGEAAARLPHCSARPNTKTQRSVKALWVDGRSLCTEQFCVQSENLVCIKAAAIRRQIHITKNT